MPVVIVHAAKKKMYLKMMKHRIYKKSYYPSSKKNFL